MAFKQCNTDEASDAIVNTLTKKLCTHADEFQVLELRIQSGKTGYQPVHRWQDDESEATLIDESGKVQLIAGQAPEELARMVVEHAIQHVESSGEKKNYKVYGLQQLEGSEGGTDEKEVFSHLIPAAMFKAGVLGGGVVSSPEHVDVYLTTFQQLQRQNDKLFAILMQTINTWPTLMTKITELIEQLGDQVSGHSGNNTEAVLEILKFEADRERRWMEHERAKAGKAERAELLAKVIEVAGPGIMELIQKLVAEVKEKMAQDQASKSSQPQSSPPPPATSSSLAARLDNVLSSVSPEGLEKAKALLSEDEWNLLERARKAPSDDEFKAFLEKLDTLWRERGDAGASKLGQQLVEAIGMPAALDLFKLIKASKE